MKTFTRRRLLQFGASAALVSGTAWSSKVLSQPDAVRSLYEAAKREGTLTYYASDDVNITERDNHVVVELTSSVRARVEELKAHTRRLTASLEERARTTARN